MALSEQDQLSLDRAMGALSGSPAQASAGMGTIFELLQRPLRRYLIRMRCPTDRIGDVLQETMLKLWRNRTDHPDNVRAFPWIMTIARNTLLDMFRRDAREPVVYFDESDGDGDDRPSPETPFRPFDPAERVHLERIIERYEREKPERAETLRMLVEGWTAAEVACYFGCSAGAARDRVYRVRCDLQAMWGGERMGADP